MNDHGLSKGNILRTLPIALQGDPSVTALADAVAEVLAKRPSEIDLLRIYPDIWRLDSALLDILAYDFKVDWWDADYSVDQKRQVLYDSFLVHRRLGTRWAVETALSAVMPGAVAEEWFEYGGDPYHFRIKCNIPESGMTAEQQRRAVSRIWYYKNLRSHMDEIVLSYEDTGSTCIAAYTASIIHGEVWPELTTGLESTAHVNTAGHTGSVLHGEVWPKLTAKLESTAKVNAAGHTGTVLHGEVWPEVTTGLESTAAVSAAGHTGAVVRSEVWPELTTKLESTADAGAAVFGVTKQAGEIWPEVTTKLESTASAGAAAVTAAKETAEIWPSEE